MKKLGLFVLAMMMSSIPAMASDYLRVDFNGGEVALPECGGSIEAKGGILGGGQANQINLIVRDSEQCSNFTLETTGAKYKLQGVNGDRGGSYTITTSDLHIGWNQVNLIVASDTKKHYDEVSIWVNVVRSEPAQPAQHCPTTANVQRGIRAALESLDKYDVVTARKILTVLVNQLESCE